MFGKGTKEGEATPISNKEVCIIAFGTTIKGNINVAGNMRLDGIIQGDVTSGGGIVMSAKAVIKGNINCQYIITEGQIDGNIVASGKVHLMPTANIKGNIRYKGIQIDHGAILNGQLSSNSAHQKNSPKEKEA